MPRPNEAAQGAPRRASLAELGRVFLKLGSIGFGGPLVHLALIQYECVEKRKWMEESDLLQGLAISQILPGPVSTQLAIYAGYRLGGLAGGTVSGIAFILPAFVLMLVLTWVYFRFGSIHAVQGLFYGMTPVVLAMILASNYRLVKSAATDRVLLVILLASAVLVAVFHFNIIALLAIAGTLGIVFYGPRTAASGGAMMALVPLPVLWQLAWFFVKVGSLIFGGGYVIIPFIEGEVVNELGWLTQREFLDGLTLGQLTPGPLVITATFIGFRVAGYAGAVVATVAIFLPSFIFLVAGAAYLARIERSPYVKAFLKTVNAAALGAILGAVWTLARASLAHAFGLTLFALALLTLVRYKVNFLKLLAAGALLGLAAHSAGW
ncbi:MAG: chromate efflux transporter [Acidobacteria bacterium]|nr:chromate efflux transporter [Acidobacteriota bacterium]